MARRFKGKQHINIVHILKKKLLSPKALVSLIVVAVLLICFILIRNYLYNSLEFVIDEIEIRGEGIKDSYLFSELSHIGLGENIFTINIKDIASSIKNDYFEVKHIRVERVFPNKLIFYVNKRIAVALISSRFYYPVDREGVILKDVGRTIPEGLPVIRGIYLNERNIGREYTSPKLAKSLILLEQLSKSNVLENYNVSGIDAADSRNLSFYIDDGLQIRIGGENFRERVEVLKKVLDDPNVDLRDIRYIDLRFKDVIIGPK